MTATTVPATMALPMTPHSHGLFQTGREGSSPSGSNLGAGCASIRGIGRGSASGTKADGRTAAGMARGREGAGRAAGGAGAGGAAGGGGDGSAGVGARGSGAG